MGEGALSVGKVRQVRLECAVLLNLMKYNGGCDKARMGAGREKE